MVAGVPLFIFGIVIKFKYEICAFALFGVFACSFVCPEAKDVEIKTLLLTVLKEPQEKEKMCDAFIVLGH